MNLRYVDKGPPLEPGSVGFMLTFSSTRRHAGLVAITAAALLGGVCGCQAPANIEDADVPAWKEKILPAASGVVLEDSGKILNRDPLVKESPQRSGRELHAHHGMRWGGREGVLRCFLQRDQDRGRGGGMQWQP